MELFSDLIYLMWRTMSPQCRVVDNRWRPQKRSSHHFLPLNAIQKRECRDLHKSCMQRNASENRFLALNLLSGDIYLTLKLIANFNTSRWFFIDFWHDRPTTSKSDFLSTLTMASSTFLGAILWHYPHKDCSRLSTCREAIMSHKHYDHPACRLHNGW